MTVLGWVAVLVGAWCVVSVVAALGLGALLRRGSVVDGDLTDQGRGRDALAMWLAEVSQVPDSPAGLVEGRSRRRAARATSTRASPRSRRCDRWRCALVSTTCGYDRIECSRAGGTYRSMPTASRTEPSTRRARSRAISPPRARTSSRSLPGSMSAS